MTRLAPLTLAALLVAAPAFAQQTATTYPPPCECVGQPGEPGPPGPPGPPATPPTPWTLRPFDLTLPAHLITLRATVPVPGGAFLLIYSAPLGHAALVDPRTGLAQILRVDPGIHRGVVFDRVDVLTPSFFVWKAGDIAWGQPWRTDAPWRPMLGWTWR